MTPGVTFRISFSEGGYRPCPVAAGLGMIEPFEAGAAPPLRETRRRAFRRAHPLPIDILY